MTTFKGAMRSYGAAVRRMEREQQRNARDAAKRFKEQQKLQEIEDASQAVRDWNSYVNMIKSLHKNCTEEINWNDIKKEERPSKPVKKSDKEDLATFKLKTYKPSIFDKIFGATKKKILNLEAAIRVAKIEDEKKYDLEIEKFKTENSDWEELQEIAKGIDGKKNESYLKALQFFNPFEDLKELGSQIEFNFSDNFIDIDLYINDLDVIPDYEINQTSTGKLSKKNMTKSKFNELYQDHICSAVLRISREIFAYLPIDNVRVNAMSNLLNTKNGHLEQRPILSVIIPQTTIKTLNLKSIDPSDSMKSFLHNMSFKNTSGFSAVEKIKLET